VTRLKMGEVMRRLAFQCLSKEILLNQVDSLMIADGRHDIPGRIEDDAALGARRGNIQR